MSIKMIPGAARLTVLGSGWNNSSIESGDGLTENGKLFEDVLGDLGFEYGGNVDWDNLSSDSDWSSELITDEDGNTCIPEKVLLDMAAFGWNITKLDADLLKYSVYEFDIKNIYGGPVSSETSWPESDSERPHTYEPPVYYIQTGENTAYLFYKEPFYHYTADGGKVAVNDKSIEVRKGSTMKVYWSSCSTHFDDNYLSGLYKAFPIEYVCWQCLYGSFTTMLISQTEKTKTVEQIQNEEVYPKKQIDGKTYYVISNSQGGR